MSIPVFYRAELHTDLSSGHELTLDGDEGHHAADVRRIRVGEQIRITDGAGLAADCKVLEAARGRVACRVESRFETPRPRPRITVVQAVLKGDRADRVVEGLTEAGADAIIPWLAQRSVPLRDEQASARALERWRAISRAAAKQSGRVWFPLVREPVDFARAVDVVAAAPAAFACHEEAERSLAEVEMWPVDELVLVIGPEGGISDDELAGFAAAGAHPVRLGPQVLRSGTAAVAALAVVSVRCGRWTSPP